jgi:hypothetical protein
MLAKARTPFGIKPLAISRYLCWGAKSFCPGAGLDAKGKSLDAWKPLLRLATSTGRLTGPARLQFAYSNIRPIRGRRSLRPLYSEEPEYAEHFTQITPFNMFVNLGLVRTPHGVVAFILWRIAAGSAQEVTIEQFLNPQNITALRLIASAANQTHFKLIIANNQTSEVAAFVDFENVFEFEYLASEVITAIGHEPKGDFSAATKHVMDTLSVPQLLALSALKLIGET